MMANPHKWMLFGWDLETWRRALEWADSDLPLSFYSGPIEPYVDIWCDWMKSGGDRGGPQ